MIAGCMVSLRRLVVTGAYPLPVFVKHYYTPFTGVVTP
jgi:hypothetical protein